MGNTFENPWKDAELISVYTRAQAIADGSLVDLMQPELIEVVQDAGFKFPLAMTAEAFYEYVASLVIAVVLQSDKEFWHNINVVNLMFPRGKTWRP